MEAIYDVKTLRIDKAGLFYSDPRQIFRRAVDTKVERVQRDHMWQSEVLDGKCGAKYTTHPFSEVLKNQFHSHRVQPLICGAFGETNSSTHRLIKRCAQFAAARTEHLDVTPLSNTMQKGNAYQVMLTQFRRALGVLSVITAAEIKM